MQKKYEIEMPPKTYIGPGCLNKIVQDIQKTKGKRCLIVTDAYLASSKSGDKVKKVVEQAGAEVFVYDGVCPNPTLKTVVNGVKMLVETGADILISLGGGSSHDCAKAIRFVYSKREERTDAVLLIAVNTTAGTGSEVTKFAIITDEITHKKLSLIDSLMLPDIAVNDANLMVDMPQRLTAYTGMDALTHALESYVSNGANYFTRANAAEAIRLITVWLPEAFKDGKNMEARDAMAYAQYVAGLAFSNSGLGMVHAMAHQLGGLYNFPHGLCNAVLLPWIIEYNLSFCKNLYAEIMDIISPGEPGSKEMKAKRLVRFLRQMNEKLKIPAKLQIPETNLKKDERQHAKEKEITILAKMTQEDPSLQFNPRKPEEKEIQEIYKQVLIWRS